MQPCQGDSKANLTAMYLENSFTYIYVHINVLRAVIQYHENEVKFLANCRRPGTFY